MACVREQIENGRMYLHELVFGDPAEPYRRAGLALAARLEDGITRLLTRDEDIDAADASTLARVITAIIHISTTATVYLHRSDEAVLADIRDQIHATLGPHHRAATTTRSMSERSTPTKKHSIGRATTSSSSAQALAGASPRSAPPTA